MKKFLAFILASLLVFIGIFAVACNPTEPPEVPDDPSGDTIPGKVYLVPGTFMKDGNKVENTISSGATKLTQEQCNELFMDNVYLCELAVGSTLPVPTTTRVDSDGNPFTFNGWWSIVGANVSYFDKVPLPSVATILYADWRADLSQRMDPVEPDPGTIVEPNHYMLITRAETGETERITLRAGSTDQTQAEQLGYGYAVQLYAIKFTLNPGDKIVVYTTGLTDKEEPQIAPFAPTRSDTREINLESAGDGSNRTPDYLSADVPAYWTSPYTIECIAAVARAYDIYIKFYYGGTTMAVYMEPTKS